MHAARLVEYSDSDEDEEKEWREYHKQRSMLRMPKTVAASASSSAASTTRPTSAEKAPPVGVEAPSVPQSTTPDRDYAFTPRKRASFLRAAASASPYSRKQPPSSPPPMSFSPRVDFSFSPSFSSNASPMSDVGGKSTDWPWRADRGSQPVEHASAEKPSTGFGDAGPTPTTTSFTFGSLKTHPAKTHSTFTFGASETTNGGGGGAQQSSLPPKSARTGSTSSPFTFDAFWHTEENSPGHAPTFKPLFEGLTKSKSVPRRGNAKTPLRQKDLHRAAKRRISGGSSTGGLSSFGGSPASASSTPSGTFSPFTSGGSRDSDDGEHVGKSMASATFRTALSPMDIEMDENTVPTAIPTTPLFSFGSTAQAKTEGLSSGVAGKMNANNVGERSRRVTAARGREFGIQVAGSTGMSSTEAEKDERVFLFGSSASSDAQQSRFFAKADTAAAFSFKMATLGSSTESPLPKTAQSAPTPAASESNVSSFTFEAAFKEYDTTTQPDLSAEAPSTSRNGAPGLETDSSVGRESLGVRLARRKQAREAQLKGGIGSVPMTGRATGAQKTLFQNRDASEESAAHRERTAAANPRGQFFCASNNVPPPIVGEGDTKQEKVTTNVFQKKTAADTTTNPFARQRIPTTAATSLFKPSGPSNEVNTKLEQMFSFGDKRKDAQPEPNPSPPPPVDNLKSNFAGFNIGVVKKASSTKGPKMKAGLRTKVKSCADGGNSKLRSPFGLSSPSTTSIPTTKPKGAFFVGTPPADPFVTPTFGQKVFNYDDTFNAEEGGRLFADTFVSAHSSPLASSSQGQQGSKNGSRSTARFEFSVEPPGVPHSEPSVGSPFPSESCSAFFPGRRILHAVPPSLKPRNRSQTSASSGTDTGNKREPKRELHRAWSEWKGLGGSAYSKRDYQEAADCYLNSIIGLETLLVEQPDLKTDQLMKDKSKLHSNRAAALMMLMQFADAQRECYQSIESDPGYTRAYLRLGRLQVMLGDVDGAKESAATARQLMAMEESRRQCDANDTAGIQKIELAVEKLEKLQVEIKWCVDVRDYSRALSHLNEALAVAPSSRSLQTQKAQVLFAQKNYSQVIEYCIGVVRKQKTIDRTSRVGTSDAEQYQQNSSTTEENEVILLGIELSMLRIRALHCENKLDDAMQQMQKLEVAAPSSDKVIKLKRLLHEMRELKHQANELFKNGDYNRAQVVYTQALSLDPTHDEYCAVIYCNRAAAFMGLQQYENALHDCNAALRRKARYPRCLLRRARCNVALKRYAAAVADFDRYLKEHPDAPSSGTAAEVELEKQRAVLVMENEAEERKRKEEQQRKEHQRSHGRSKSHHHQQQRRQNRHAWDDSKFYEEFWRSSTGSNGARQQSNARGTGSNGAAQPKQRRTHYEVLAIAKSATQDEVKKAYRKLALLHHPDKAKDTVHAELFKDMTAAYNVLSDTSARAKYDREIQYGGYGRYYEC